MNRLKDWWDEAAERMRTGRPLFVGKADPRHVAVALQQLALMMESGIPIGQALEVLAETQDQPRMTEVLGEIHTLVATRGYSVANAMAIHPDAFPPSTLTLVRAGEQSGDLANRLRRAADLLERSNKLVAEAKRAVTGPMITAVSGTALIYAICTLVLPKFLDLYAEMEVELPALSKLVIFIVRVMNNPIFFILLFLGVAVVLVNWPYLKQRLFELAVTTPGIKRFVGSVLCAQLCELLAGLSRDGIPVDRAIAMMEQTTGYEYHAHWLGQVKRHIQYSGNFSEGLSLIPYFPRLLGSMASVAEESGSVPEMLSSAAYVMEQEVESVLTQAVNILEPLVICVMGGVMCFFFVGMFLPVYGILSKLGG